ncbi:MAG: tetratricopeptide repeat protein [Janthinobacterium lividum]
MLRPRLPLLLALLALGGATYAYFAGEAATLPVRLVPHLAPVPVVLDSVAAGPAWLPLPLNGYAVTLTHDVGGPYTHPLAATLWLLVLAGALAGWLAVVSGLRRPAFVAGTAPVIFLLSSLNVDGLGLFGGSRPYFLWLSLGVLGGAAGGLHLLGERVRLPLRALLLTLLVGALSGLVYAKTPLSPADTALQLAAFALPAGAVLVALLALWVGIENVRALLWFNTQAEQPESRFGLFPYLLASALYLGALGLYWYQGSLALGYGLHLDPLVLLLPAVLTSALGLRLRAPSYAGWVPYPAARVLLGMLTAAAAAALGYAFYTANAPLLDAARAFSALALGLLGAAFLLYSLLNFGPLIRQRLRVYRVAFEPRRFPFYAVYILGLGVLAVYGVQAGWPWLAQVQAGQYNLLGDATRQQSETRPDDLPLALLAERYYAESGDVLDRFNRPAQLGRAALYRFRSQLQNEQNALRRALLRQPDEKVSLRLAALLTGPGDFLDALAVLRQARREQPRSFALTADLAQLFTRSALTDSVATYLDQAARLAPGSPTGQANQLGFLLSQGLYSAARQLAAKLGPAPAEAALAANESLLPLLARQAAPPPAVPAYADLDDAEFAQLYHAALLAARAPGPAATHLLPRLAALAARPANEAYYEQLLYLRSLLLHATGQELAARQALGPLAAGTSQSAAYYQYTLGLWQLQQQQYTTAATQLGQAAALGATDARPAQAWALALAGRPDSARAAARRLALGADTAQRPAGRRLVAALAAGPLPTSLPGRPLAGAAALAQAQAAEAAGRPESAARRYRRAVAQAPFNPAVVLAAGRFFSAQQQPGNAYEVLQQGLTENPDDPALLPAFALAAASAGVADLGQAALAQLRPRLDPAAYANLVVQFEARRRAHAAAAAEFETPGPALPAGH